MCLELSLKKQNGAGLPIALFIITVLSSIVLSISQLQESSGNAISLQIQSQRAFFAAESGAQVAIASLLKDADGSPLDNCSFVDKKLNFDEQGLSGCSADVSCDDASIDEVISIESKGSCGVEDSVDHARRTIEVRLHAD